LFTTREPKCSKEASKARIDNTVELAVGIGTDGLVHDISVVTPLGYGLTEAAIKGNERVEVQAWSKLG
jgi:hypothetical protein